MNTKILLALPHTAVFTESQLAIVAVSSAIITLLLVVYFLIAFPNRPERPLLALRGRTLGLGHRSGGHADGLE
jgi:hypothetical protein